MRASRSLLEVLRNLKDHEEKEKLASAITRDEWIAAIVALMRQLRAYLRPALSEGLAQVEVIDGRFDDPALGAYEAPSLRISLPGGRVISVRPAGVLSVGAKGWVDMTCGATRALLVLNRRGEWKIRGPAADGREGRLEPLDEVKFASVIAHLVA